MMKERQSWEEEDREKLEERESVCECNSLLLSNPGEFTDCRGKERGREAEIEGDRGREREGGGCDHSREREMERYRGRASETEKAETE